MVYQDKKDLTWYATALEFNLTVDGVDSVEVFLELKEAIKNYIKTAKELKMQSVLNQEIDKELEAIWKSNVEINTKKTIKSPYIINFVGILKNQ